MPSNLEFKKKRVSRAGFENILDLAKMWKVEGDMNAINQCAVYDTRNSRILFNMKNLGFILEFLKRNPCDILYN